MTGLLLKGGKVGLTSAGHLSRTQTWTGWTPFPFLFSSPSQPDCTHRKQRHEEKHKTPSLRRGNKKIPFLLLYLDQVPLPCSKGHCIDLPTSAVKILGKGPGLRRWPQVGRKENWNFPCNTKQGCFGNKKWKDHAPMGWELRSPRVHLGWGKCDIISKPSLLQHQVPRGKRTKTNPSFCTIAVPWFPVLLHSLELFLPTSPRV